MWEIYCKKPQLILIAFFSVTCILYVLQLLKKERIVYLNNTTNNMKLMGFNSVYQKLCMLQI